MEEQNNYEINTKLLNDIKCNLHQCKKQYNKYCVTCNKNLCPWCEGHNNHQIIEFNSLDKGPELFKIYEEKLGKMESINKDFFEKTLSGFKKRKNDIQKMLDDINEDISDIKRTSNIFDKHLNFNKTILNAYKEGEFNYYILKNFNNLSFDDIKKYEKKWNINYFNLEHFYLQRVKEKLSPFSTNGSFSLSNYAPTIRKIIIKDSNPGKIEEFKNMWISEKYCKSWGLKEGIREFLQNQYDGIISKIESKKNLKVIKIGKKENINDISLHLNFDLKSKKDNKIYGQIRYENNTLTISNEGLLWLGDFLLGSSKDEDDNSDLIGTFGEGMKLAILALCRLDKNVTIISSNKKYNFIIKEDQLFLKDNIPQRCLHFKYGIFHNNDKDMIKVIIKNITSDEWGSQIINFLWLLDDDAQIYTSLDENDEEIGQILSEDYLRCKIYVKGIFVQNIKNYGKIKSNCPGFNVDLELDRDRNCIPDNYELKNLISSVISSFCNNNIKTILEIEKMREIEKQLESQNKKKKQNCKKIKLSPKKSTSKKRNDKKSDEISTDEDEIEFIDYERIFNDIIDIIKNDDYNIIDSYSFADSLSQECIEYIWKKFYLDKNKKENPVYKINKVSNFINEKNLSKDFYPFFEVNYSMMKILKKSKNYISVKNKFSLYVQNAVTVEPKGIYKEALQEIYSKVKIMKESFDGKVVLFKKFEKEDKDFCFNDKTNINFSALKLKEPVNNSWKFWIFVKILQFLEIKIEENYQFINNVFENKEKYPFNDSGAII